MKTAAKTGMSALAIAGAAGIFLAVGGAAPVPGTALGAATKPAVCMARYVPERDDDIFWENDRIAHRIYGPALETSSEHLVTSGIDIWVKKTRDLFMDDQLKLGQHDDHGKGMDCYDVQHTCGCGGLGVWDDAHHKLMRSKNWAKEKILQNGPEVASFWVSYAPWNVGDGREVSDERTFTLPAGTNFTRMVDTLDDAAIQHHEWPDLLVAIGIAKRQADGKKFRGEDHWVMDKKKGLMLYWEPQQFDSKNGDEGQTGCAVLVDPKSVVKFVTDQADQNFMIVKVMPGKPWVYYEGACWSLGLDFHDEKGWEDDARGYAADFDAGKK